ncbi:MAG: hypothetical protein ACRD6N_14945 [Pyrinomonadaceae bacterium]
MPNQAMQRTADERVTAFDLSDSLQLVSVKHGRSSSCVPGFKTVLITADRALASAAKTEGLRVWNCEERATPPPQ